MIIATQPYYKVERIVTADSIETVVHQRSLFLYANRIKSAYREFPLAEIFDVSFRDLGQGHGVLYLHTKQGVYAYPVDSAVESFITEVKSLLI